jgi:hypothetical protein
MHVWKYHNEHTHTHIIQLIYIKKCEKIMVAHTYNPRYWGGRDWEDHDLRPAQAKS